MRMGFIVKWIWNDSFFNNRKRYLYAHIYLLILVLMDILFVVIKCFYSKHAQESAHLESPFCSPAAKMQRAAWWEAPRPKGARHPVASHSPAEAPGLSAASRSAAVDGRPAWTFSRPPGSRPRSCLPVEISFSRSSRTTFVRLILSATTCARQRRSQGPFASP